MRRDTRAREPIFLSESSQLSQPLPHIVSSRKEKERDEKLQLATGKMIDEGKTESEREWPSP
jgi:hypothetical protein